MKDTLIKFSNDSATAFATGTVAEHATNGGNQTLVVLLTLFAPLLRDLAVKLIDKLLSKYIKKQSNEQ